MNTNASNIIYFNPDQMRADLLSCYGDFLVETPNIDRLAATGVRFDQCQVQHTVCSPSRCSFMTGWYPHVRGHRTLWHLLQPDEPNTMKYLKQAGYQVHWIGKNDLLAPESFKDSVSHVYACNKGAKGDRNIFDSDDPGYWSFLYGPTSDHKDDWYQVNRAIELVRNWEPGDTPFMIFLAMPSPHCPFTCPQPWYDMYDPDDLPPLRPAELENQPVFKHLIRKYRGLDQLDEKILRKIRAVYLGMISYVDYLLGQLLTALEETGRDKDTSIFFFSDHGEWAGDYGLVEKWQSGVDDCLSRVPMIVRTPDCKPGHVVEEPVECFDIMPTTLELAGIECQHTHFARSMMPQLKGHAGDPDRAVFVEGGYDPHEPHCYEGTVNDIGKSPHHIYYPKGLLQQERPEASVRCTKIRTTSYELIYRPKETSELYDLTTDPEELNNVYNQPEYAEIQADLERQLLDWYVHTSDVVPFTRNPRDFPPDLPQQ